MKILGLDHIGICAKNPEALANWYIDNFGFTLAFKGNVGNYFVESPDHILLEIMVPQAGKDPDGAEPAVGWKHIAIVPENFDEAVAECKAKGIGVNAPVNRREDGYCTFFFADPEGNVVHFSKWADDRGMFR